MHKIKNIRKVKSSNLWVGELELEGGIKIENPTIYMDDIGLGEYKLKEKLSRLCGHDFAEIEQSLDDLLQLKYEEGYDSGLEESRE